MVAMLTKYPAVAVRQASLGPTPSLMDGIATESKLLPIRSNLHLRSGFRQSNLLQLLPP